MGGLFIMVIMAFKAVYLEILIWGECRKILMAFKACAASSF
jgi:hypothetical protein